MFVNAMIVGAPLHTRCGWRSASFPACSSSLAVHPRPPRPPASFCLPGPPSSSTSFHVREQSD